MPSDLIAVIFPEADSAHQAWQFTEILRDRQMYGLGSVALISQDADGNLYMKLFFAPDVPHDARQRVLLSVLAEILFDSSSEMSVPQISSIGLDNLFAEQVAQAMGPERSALLIYLPSDNLGDVNQLITFLDLMEDTVFRTTLPRAVEDALLNAGLNDDRAMLKRNAQ